jgi:DNA-binding NarL/FixJ family response regulator
MVASNRCGASLYRQRQMTWSNAAKVGGFVSKFAQPGDAGAELRLRTAAVAGSGSDPPEPIRQLAQSLARRAEELVEEAGSAPPKPGDVLLDFDADGIRCLLVVSRTFERRSEIRLSPREEEIAAMVAEGYPNKTIAAKLQISSWTVSSYLRKLFVKLDVHSRTAMVARLFEEGLIPDHGEPLWSTAGDERDGKRASGVGLGGAAAYDR